MRQGPCSRDGRGRTTLSPAEREIARNSFTDRNVSDAEKEYLYLQNKKKYLSMKASGEYSTQGEG